MLYADVFCLLTHNHLKRWVFFGTLSRSQDQLLLQYDSATETEGLGRTLQQRLLQRRWTPARCNKARYVTEVQQKNRFILCVMIWVQGFVPARDTPWNHSSNLHSCCPRCWSVARPTDAQCSPFRRGKWLGGDVMITVWQQIISRFKYQKGSVLRCSFSLSVFTKLYDQMDSGNNLANLTVIFCGPVVCKCKRSHRDVWKYLQQQN